MHGEGDIFTRTDVS